MKKHKSALSETLKQEFKKDLELFEPIKRDLKKKICIGAVSHRALQADRTDCEHERIEGELTMIEAPFGSASPIWPVAPIPGFALQTPLQTPMSFANAALGATTLGSSGLNPIT